MQPFFSVLDFNLFSEHQAFVVVDFHMPLCLGDKDLKTVMEFLCCVTDLQLLVTFSVILLFILEKSLICVISVAEVCKNQFLPLSFVLECEESFSSVFVICFQDSVTSVI